MERGVKVGIHQMKFSLFYEECRSFSCKENDLLHCHTVGRIQQLSDKYETSQSPRMINEEQY